MRRSLLRRFGSDGKDFPEKVQSKQGKSCQGQTVMHVTDVAVSVRGELVVGTEWGVGRTAPVLSMHVCMICILCVRSKECSGQEEGADAIPGRL